MRISDWSSDVCSSDLRCFVFPRVAQIASKKSIPMSVTKLPFDPSWFSRQRTCLAPQSLARRDGDTSATHAAQISACTLQHILHFAPHQANDAPQDRKSTRLNSSP